MNTAPSTGPQCKEDAPDCTGMPWVDVVEADCTTPKPVVVVLLIAVVVPVTGPEADWETPPETASAAEFAVCELLTTLLLTPELLADDEAEADEVDTDPEDDAEDDEEDDDDVEEDEEDDVGWNVPHEAGGENLASFADTLEE